MWEEKVGQLNVIKYIVSGLLLCNSMTVKNFLNTSVFPNCKVGDQNFIHKFKCTNASKTCGKYYSNAVARIIV